MKTLEEIKKEVAVKYRFKSWERILELVSLRDCPINWFEEYENEVAEEYARQCCEEQIKACLENAEVIEDPDNNNPYTSHRIIDIESILNTPNVVTTK